MKDAVTTLPVLMLGVTPWFGLWTDGGLETPFYTVILLLSLWLFVEGIDTNHHKKKLLSSLLFAFLSMTRPEGVGVFALALTASAVISLRERLDYRSVLLSHLSIVVIFALIYLPWIIWRIWYYGSILPNSFYVKTNTGSLLSRLFFYRHFVGIMLAFAIAGVVGLWQSKEADHRRMILLAPIVGQGLVAPLVFAWMPGYRYLLPAIPTIYVLSLGGGLVIRRGLWRFTSTQMANLVLCLLVLGASILLIACGLDQGFIKRVNHVADLTIGSKKMGQWIASLGLDDWEWLAVPESGAIAYWSDHSLLLDIHHQPLNDKHLTIHPQDTDYILDKRPAVIVLKQSPDGWWETWLWQDNRFKSRYSEVHRVRFGSVANGWTLVAFCRNDLLQLCQQ